MGDRKCFSDFSSCLYIKHFRRVVFHEPVHDMIFIKPNARCKQEMCYSNSSSAYELINNFIEKYVTVIYILF